VSNAQKFSIEKRVHKFQFSVTTKFFVIESSSKILETRALDSCQMHKNFQSKIHSCWSLGDWWDLEKKLRNKIFLVDDEVSVLSKYQIFASLNWVVKSYLLKLHARRKKLMVEMLSKKTHRPNGATKDSLTLGNNQIFIRQMHKRFTYFLWCNSITW
jgi:hypothetical protein